MRFADPALAGGDRLDLPRGEPRRLVAEVAAALAARAPEEELRGRLAAAAAALDLDGSDERSLARVYDAALPLLARSEAVRAPLADAEPLLEQMDDEDRAAFAPRLARVAAPALGVDLAVMKDEGYRYVATYPPEGSEGVDVVGRAASWLTRRMTMDGDAPRLALRRFLAVVAEELELELPAAAAAIDLVLAEPMPESPPADVPFLALARGLVEEAIAELGFPW